MTNILAWALGGLLLMALANHAGDDAKKTGNSIGWATVDKSWTFDGNTASVKTGGQSVALIKGDSPRDFTFTVDVNIRSGAKKRAGILFCADASDSASPAGYAAILDAGQKTLTFGRYKASDKSFAQLARRSVPVKPNRPHRITVTVRKNHLQVFADPVDYLAKNPNLKPWPKIDMSDEAFASGSLGLFAEGAEVAFSDITRKEPPKPFKGAAYNNAGGLLPDIADPFVLRHKGEYYVYGTGGNGIKVYKSKDLAHWSEAIGATEGYALHNRDSWGNKWFWAPEILQRNGRFYMYYSVEERIAVATSESPLGPFKQPKMEPYHLDVGEIDTHPFVDDDGKVYMYWVKFDRGNVIYVAEMTDDLLGLKEETITFCFRKEQKWEDSPDHNCSVNEGPWVIKHKGIYYCAYSANSFMSKDYGVGYATAPTPYGPWTKYEHNPILSMNATVYGPGHHCVIDSPDGKERFMVYHTHYDTTRVQRRKLAIDRMRFAPNPDGGPDILEVWGPTMTPQPLPSGVK